MTQMLFFLRYRSQLRRTRPEEVALLEETVAQAAEAAGGRVRFERRLLSASFDEGSLGFSLDLVTLIDAVQEALDRAVPELFGHVCVFCRDPGEGSTERLCRVLASAAGGGGIWCGSPIHQELEPYAVFERPGTRGDVPAAPPGKELPAGYLRMAGLKIFIGSPPAAFFPYRERIIRAMEQGGNKNTLLCGPEFMGKRDGIYHFCAALAGAGPPLSVHFGAGGPGPVCFVDALEPRIRDFIEKGAAEDGAGKLRDLDALGAPVLGERLGDEFSPATVERARRFFQKLLELYRGVSTRRELIPVLILENIHRADAVAVRLFTDLFAALPDKDTLLIYGTCDTAASNDSAGARPVIAEEQLRLWGRVFPRIRQFDVADAPFRGQAEIPVDLWELSYAFSVMGRYFPGPLFGRIFGEGGKNPAMAARALRILVSWGMIDSPADPRPRIVNFIARAAGILGDRREKIHALVRERLLAWVRERRLRPCFPLLRALMALGTAADDELILKAIRGDLVRGTYGAIDAAIREGSFIPIIGEERSPALLSIYKTLRALIHDNGTGIREAFQEAPPATGPGFPGYRAQMLMNLTAFHLGLHDIPAASGTVKEALLITQRRKEGAARAYRLFAMTELSRGRLEDALEYFSFAVDNAEKPGEEDERGIAAYYAAAAQSLFGNLSKAERLARQAEEAALNSGQGEWADRARFLRGKLRFDGGYYKDALGIFEDLRERPVGSPTPVQEGLINAWIYRAAVYLRGGIQGPLPEALSGDGLLFEMEAAFLGEDYPQTVALTEKLRNSSPEEDFLSIEQPDWRSGFAQNEGLLQPPGTLRERLVTAYEALARCRLDSAGKGRGEAASRLQRLIRDEILPDTDPCDTFYLYAYYLVLRETGGTTTDMNTVISLAFKRLQRRASRIDDIHLRRNFLSAHYWNGALGLAAREHKLI